MIKGLHRLSEKITVSIKKKFNITINGLHRSSEKISVPIKAV